jgi:hypothetical protein
MANKDIKNHNLDSAASRIRSDLDKAIGEDRSLFETFIKRIDNNKN